MLTKIKQKRSNLSTLKRFADVHDFVTFGTISANDHLERLRGVTFARESTDSHFMHGNINGFEVTFFTRNSTHGIIHSDLQQYDWTVFSIALQTHTLPHVIFDNKKHDKAFYRSVFARFPRLRLASDVLKTVNPSAAYYFDVYAAPEDTYRLSSVFSDEILQRMTYYYGKFDVEVDDKRLYVFARGTQYSFNLLQDMLNEALWLSARLEIRAEYLHAQQEESEADLRLVSA